MKINYLSFGQQGSPLVFLHGWQQDSRSFSPLIPFLFKNYRLFLLDLPGFGQSSFPPPNFSSVDYAKAISKWIKEKKLEGCVLVGHSFGGKVAALVAANEPKLVSKLILIASAGIPHPKKYYRIKKFLPEKISKIIAPLLKPALASRDYQQSGRLLSIFKIVVKEDLQPIFPKISVPTLIIWGENDQELPPEDGKAIQRLIPQSKLIVTSGGHFPFWENPQKIAKLIEQFAGNDKN